MSGDSDNTVELKHDKTSEKYQLLLKFVNKILCNINKDEIDDLTKFTNIDREDIIKDINKTVLDDMADELFQHFNKKKVGYYRKTDAIVLNCLRGLVKEIGYELVKSQKGKMVNIDGKSYERTCMIYSVK